MKGKEMLQVVVVDDEVQITNLVKTFLQFHSKNIDIHTYNDPEEARAYLMQNPVDVLITDYKMPKYDGIQLMKCAPETAIKVLVSGYVSEITEASLKNINALFFEKPVPLKKLGAIIHEADGRKRKLAS
jgi:two-component system response regulator YesN